MNKATDLTPVAASCRLCDPPIPLTGGQRVVAVATVKSGPFLFSNVSIIDHGNGGHRIQLPSGSRDRRTVVIDAELYRAIIDVVLDAYRQIADMPLAMAPPVTETTREHPPAP